MFNTGYRTGTDSRRSSSRPGSSFRGARTGSSFRGGGRSRFGRARKAPRFFDPSLLTRKAQVTKSEIYVPKHVFADFDLAPELKKNIEHKGYEKPTPIQDQVIPLLIQGKDVIGLANTGTGKTVAFLLPLINKVLNNRNQKSLIIAPTRELAVQIDEELRSLVHNLRIYSTVCIGGVSLGRQMSELRRGPNFTIGTPGRLKDLAQRRAINFKEYRSIVLDEVDRMLDMGFLPEMQKIVESLAFPRQSLFFSATLPEKTKVITKDFLKDPVFVSVGTKVAAENVDQDVVRVRGAVKIDLLHDLLLKEGFDKVLIFGRTKWGIEKLTEDLSVRGFKVSSIHGNKNQSQRQRALAQFKEGRIQALLATDIASRGLDISDVTHVINYELPESYEDYIHRIGRTGRIGKKGTALSFID
jgi:superfamily II DNA/RNA helicase